MENLDSLQIDRCTGFGGRLSVDGITIGRVVVEGMWRWWIGGHEARFVHGVSLTMHAAAES